MRSTPHTTNNVTITSALRPYGSKTAAILMISSSEPRMSLGLGRVFDMHEAPFLRMDEDLDWDLNTVGDCVILPDMVKVVLEGVSGGPFAGLLLTMPREGVNDTWVETAEFNGTAWVALLDPVMHSRIQVADSPVKTPVGVRILKLDTRS